MSEQFKIRIGHTEQGTYTVRLFRGVRGTVFVKVIYETSSHIKAIAVSEFIHRTKLDLSQFILSEWVQKQNTAFEVIEDLREWFRKRDMSDEESLLNESHYLIQEYFEQSRWEK